MSEPDQRAVETGELAFFAGYYQREPYNPTGWRLRLTREIRSLMRASGQRHFGRVLSLGCGDGQFEIMLARCSTHVTGLDISPAAIALATQKAAAARAANVTFRCQPLSELVWGERFDTVISLAFFHHLTAPDLTASIRAIHSHLAPGGVLYAQDPNVRGALRTIVKRVRASLYDRYHTPDECELDPREMRAELTSAGFDDVRLGYIDVTLIPSVFLLAKGPAWPLFVCEKIDWLWCRSPFAPWASGFTACARKRS